MVINEREFNGVLPKCVLMSTECEVMYSVDVVKVMENVSFVCVL